MVYSESYNQDGGSSFLHGEAHSRHYNCSVTQKGIVLFLMAGVFWGLPYFFIALAIESFSTPSVVFARTLLGALVLIPYAALTGGLKPALKAWPYVLVFAVVESIICTCKC